MISASQFLWFAFATLMLNITPGNDMLYVATRSTTQGLKAGVISALGIMAGCFVHILAAVIGLSALISQSAIAFEIIKYAGAAYLVYLGVKALMSRNQLSVPGNTAQMSNSKIFWQGAITNVLNPKVALFFLAFIPQFVNTFASHISWQILLLGSWFDFSGTIVNILIAILFAKAGKWLSNSAWFIKWQQKLTGFILISLGIKVAFSSRK